MSRRLTLGNRQRTRAVDLRRLRRLAGELLAELSPARPVQLEVCLLNDAEMTRLNETFLHHAGTTDVITFNYSERGTRDSGLASLHGEVFLCVDEAVRQARRFRTTWQTELARYLVHGVLHLLGHDDRTAAARRKMKREEDRLVAALAARFPLSRLARKPRLRA
jgi:probable rRNA maturation factor